MTALNKFAANYSDSDVVKWGLVFMLPAQVFQLQRKEDQLKQLEIG